MESFTRIGFGVDLGMLGQERGPAQQPQAPDDAQNNKCASSPQASVSAVIPGLSFSSSTTTWQAAVEAPVVAAALPVAPFAAAFDRVQAALNRRFFQPYWPMTELLDGTAWSFPKDVKVGGMRVCVCGGEVPFGLLFSASVRLRAMV